MAAQAYFPTYRAQDHEPQGDVERRKNEILRLILPESSQASSVAAVIVTNSGGKSLLLLSDLDISFLSDILNLGDELPECFTVVSSNRPLPCCSELLAAITASSDYIELENEMRAHIVALQITRPDDRSFLPPLFLDPSLQQRVAQAIMYGGNVVVSGYQIVRLANTWIAGAANNLHGLAFETHDHVLRAWLHGNRPEAIGSAEQECEEEQQLLKRKTRLVRERDPADPQRRANEKCITALNSEASLNRDIYEQHLKSAESRLRIITKLNSGDYDKDHRLNACVPLSARQATLSCRAAIVIADDDSRNLFRGFVCRKVTSIRRAMLRQMLVPNSAVEDGAVGEIRDHIKLIVGQILVEQRSNARVKEAMDEIRCQIGTIIHQILIRQATASAASTASADGTEEFGHKIRPMIQQILSKQTMDAANAEALRNFMAEIHEQIQQMIRTILTIQQRRQAENAATINGILPDIQRNIQLMIPQIEGAIQRAGSSQGGQSFYNLEYTCLKQALEQSAADSLSLYARLDKLDQLTLHAANILNQLNATDASGALEYKNHVETLMTHLLQRYYGATIYEQLRIDKLEELLSIVPNNGQPVILVKRLHTRGGFVSGLSDYCNSENGLDDPNKNDNDVHVPIEFKTTQGNL